MIPTRSVQQSWRTVHGIYGTTATNSPSALMIWTLSRFHEVYGSGAWGSERIPFVRGVLFRPPRCNPFAEFPNTEDKPSELMFRLAPTEDKAEQIADQHSPDKTDR